MLPVIPIPKYFMEKDGCFELSDAVKIQSDFALTLIENRMTDSPSPFCIIKDETVEREGYRLSVTKEGVTVNASSEIGAYYALQTIRRLTDDHGRVSCCEIDDAPRFRWRGLQLDEARHFFGKDTVKRLLDLMFAEKLNVFHWHLTDDQGWRIEIKKYPLLTEIASKRKKTHIGGWDSFRCDHQPHGGYYTQEEIKEIVAYAKERGITVVPEIDFPAHSAATMVAYPYLSCFEKETEVPYYFGGLIPQWKHFDFRWNRTLCCGKESMFEFVFGVLDEVCELFDSEYLHMGGDEAPKGEWKRCRECQRIIRENHLQNETELQGWFENRVADYLAEKGKKLIGWNEIIRAKNLNTDDDRVTIQYWTRKRDPKAEAFVNSGGSMILSNHQAFYFDMPYAMYPLKNTYEYRPEDYGVNSGNIKNVLGIEGELWSEWIADSEKLEMQAVPRMQALSEVAWSPEEKRNFNDFKERLDRLKPYFDDRHIHYACDEIALAKQEHRSRTIVRKFRRGNPYLEVEINRSLKLKGDK